MKINLKKIQMIFFTCNRKLSFKSPILANSTNLQQFPWSVFNFGQKAKSMISLIKDLNFRINILEIQCHFGNAKTFWSLPKTTFSSKDQFLKFDHKQFTFFIPLLG